MIHSEIYVPVEASAGVSVETFLRMKAAAECMSPVLRELVYHHDRSF